MRSALMIPAAGLVLFLTQVQSAAAQYPAYGNAYGNMTRAPQQAPSGSTALSPWLNLTRGGNPAANYYLGVLPEFDRRNFQSAVVSGWSALQSSSSAPPQPLDQDIPTLPQTGHLSAFTAYGSYYTYPTQQRTYFPLNPNQARTPPR